MKLLSRSALLCAACSCCIALYSNTASAQDFVPGLTVSPAQLEYTVSAKDTARTNTVTLNNGYNVPINLTATFKGIDQDAGILAPSDTLDTNLARSLLVSPNAITIPAHGTAAVTVQVLNISALAPGGQYATLILTQQQAGNKQLALRSSISINMFIVKTDGAQADVRLDTSKINGWLMKLPTTATLSVRNTGNIHTVPHGIVQVLGRNNSVLRQGIVNESSIPLLPGKSLQTTVSLNTVTRPWLPARITVATLYRADGANDVRTVRFSRLYIPAFYPFIGLVLAGSIVSYGLRRHKTAHKKTVPTTRTMPQIETPVLAIEDTPEPIVPPEEIPTKITPKIISVSQIADTDTESSTHPKTKKLPAARVSKSTSVIGKKKPAAKRATASKKRTSKTKHTAK